MPSFLDLPRELRDQIYEYSMQHRNDHEIDTTCFICWHGAKTPSSAITATSRQIHSEYEAVAIRSWKVIAFEVDWVGKVLKRIDHFYRYFSKHLATLRRNKVRIEVSFRASGDFDLAEIYTWALFLIKTRLEVTYPMWDTLLPDGHPGFRRQCVINEHTPRAVRNHMPEIRKIVLEFDRWALSGHPVVIERYFATLRLDDPSMPWNN